MYPSLNYRSCDLALFVFFLMFHSILFISLISDRARHIRPDGIVMRLPFKSMLIGNHLMILRPRIQNRILIIRAKTEADNADQESDRVSIRS
jgi:hypothetical protein